MSDVSKRAVVACPRCGELHSPSAQFCLICSASLTGAPQTLSAAPALAPKPPPAVRPLFWPIVSVAVVSVLFVSAGMLYRIANPPRNDGPRSQGIPVTVRFVSPKSSTPSSSSVTAPKKYLPAPGDTPDIKLVKAVASNDIEAVGKLISEEGASASALSKNGIPAFVMASSRGYVPIMQLLLDKGCDINIKSADLSPSGEKIGGFGALHMAAARGQADSIQFLLSKGANIKLTSTDGSIPLSHAATRGQTTAARLLIDAGSDINHKSNDGITPLLIAADQGHTECVKLLLEKGADVRIKGASGDSALYHAEQRGHTEVAQLLRAAGAV